MNAKLTAIGLLDEIVDLKVPGREIRAEIIQLRPSVDENEILEMAEATQYFRIRNLINLIGAEDTKLFIETEK